MSLFPLAFIAPFQDWHSLCNNLNKVVMGNLLHNPNQMGIDYSVIPAIANTQRYFTDVACRTAFDYAGYTAKKFVELNVASIQGGRRLAEHMEKQVDILHTIVHKNPDAIKAVERRLGCQFSDTKRYAVIAETPRFVLYQVLPSNGVPFRKNGKPIIHRAPFILPEYIIDLLPYDGVSYVGAFANSGTPTYFMHCRDITATEAVQKMTEEEMATDLKYFAKKVHDIHGRKATLNGTCQGALPLLRAICCESLQLEKDVDAFIGTVPAYALYCSKRFAEIGKLIPNSLNSVGMITKRLPNGNGVVSGHGPTLTIRMSDLQNENPLAVFLRDIADAEKGQLPLIAIALRRYLQMIMPMPISLTEMSSVSATVPITNDGILPGNLFGAQISLAHAIRNGVKFHIVAGEKDTVVDLASALAMFEIPIVKAYAGATFSIWPGGHVATLTTCSMDGSKKFIGKEGGPLYYHLEQEEECMVV